MVDVNIMGASIAQARAMLARSMDRCRCGAGDEVLVGQLGQRHGPPGAGEPVPAASTMIKGSRRRRMSRRPRSPY